MSSDQLKRLEQGIRNAHERGNVEHVKILGAEYRRLQAEMAAQSQTAEPDTSFGAALQFGVDNTGRALGGAMLSLGELTGSDWLKEKGQAKYDENQQDIERRKYQRPDDAEGVWSNIKEGDVLGAAKSLGFAAAESAPSVAVGAGTSLAAAASSPVAIPLALGGTAFGTAYALGDARQEKIEKGLDPTANLQDLGTAVASGLIELTPLGKGGFVLSFTKEGLQEAAQEGLIIGNTAIQGGEYIPEEVGNRLIEAGVTGGAISKATDVTVNTTVAGAKKVSDSVRLDTADMTPDKVAAAKRLERVANDPSELANVSDVGDHTAKGVASTAMTQAREEAKIIVKNLQALAKARNDQEGLAAVNTVASTIGNQTKPTTGPVLTDLTKYFGDTADVQRLQSLSNEINAIQDFVMNSDRDMGGLTKITKKFDITDKRNTTAWGAYALMAGGFAATGSPYALAAGVALNRSARVLDNITNRRSRVKRFVDSAKASGVQPTQITGPKASDVLAQMKTQADARQAYFDSIKKNSLDPSITPNPDALLLTKGMNKRAEAMDSAIVKANAVNKNITLNPQALLLDKYMRDAAAREDRAALDRSKAEMTARTKQSINKDIEQNPDALLLTKGMRKAAETADKLQANKDRLMMNEGSTERIFAADNVPADVPFYAPYRRWQQATGVGPRTTLEVLNQLAAQGRIPPSIPERFRKDIRSFGTKDDETYAVQNMVREEVNPDYVPDFSDPAPEVDPETVLRKLEQESMSLTDSRRKQKAIQGDKRYKTALLKVDKFKNNLSGPQYAAMSSLVEGINSPDMTRSERFATVRDALKTIFPDDPVMQDFWFRELTPLAAIGNDYKISREDTEAKAEKAKEEKFKKKKEKASKRKKKKKDKGDGSPPVGKTKADVALEKLNATDDTTTSDPLDQSKAEATMVQDDTEPQVPRIEYTPDVANRPKDRKRKKLKDRVIDRITQIRYARLLAENEGPNLDQYIASLPKSSEGRVEGLIYQMANSRITQNMLTDAYASQYGLPPAESARVVDDALTKMEAKGQLKRISPKNTNRMLYNGSIVKDEGGNIAEVVQIEFNEGPMNDRLEVAKAVRMAERMVDQVAPGTLYSPTNLSDGVHKAIKGAGQQVDGRFTPLIDFLNNLRTSRLAISEKIFDQVSEALSNADPKRVGTIGDQLVTTGSDGKPDQSNLRALAQLLDQLDTSEDMTIRQEWSAGENGRVYSKNGLAHSQAGDMMKGLIRAPSKAYVGGKEGLNMLMHNIGNLLGYDKEAPAARRRAIFDNDLVDKLVTFAENPFGRNTMKSSRGNSTGIQEMIDKGEGFFQVLNAAHEVRDMVNWARERHPDKNILTRSQLLQDPDVVADLEMNYKTDMLVQLDAKNNSFQNVGILTGDQTILTETGLLPVEGVDPETGKSPDIYIQPAQRIASRIPELVELDLPVSDLRKVFKRPIGNYLYATAHDSRKRAFAQELGKLAGDAELFGIGSEDALITIDPSVVDGLKSKDGFTFTAQPYDAEGNTKTPKNTTRRLKEVENGFKLETKKGDTWVESGMVFPDANTAIKEAFSNNLYTRMSQELARDLNTNFPVARKFMSFASAVANILGDKGSVVVPTADGIPLTFSFKDTPVFTTAPVTLANGKTVNMGINTGDSKSSGRGLAAFLAHQMDAYVLREVARRMGEMKAFNPIHDSYGFHPSEAAKGQATWVEVMQDLGQGDYNLFQQILEANGITLEQYLENGGDPDILLNRQEVPRVPASQIPTALS